ncbi:MAG: response regulator [Verrucomicrobia bacterium]|nr:response regulator [Verrucomicrobiota bacterium]
MKTRVLLVDDDPSVATAVGGVLLSEDYDVFYAQNGEEAIKNFRTNGAIDIVLLDLCMPVKSGWDTFEGLTAIDPLLPIIVITARSDQYQLSEAAGVGALMEKPLNIPRLLDIMRKLLAEGPTDRLARIAGKSPHTLHPQLLRTN